MTIKIISFSTISKNSETTMAKDILNILKLNIGDEIIFTLKNRIIYIKKYFKDITLDPEETYVSSATIYGPSRPGEHGSCPRFINISSDIRKLIDANIGDRIVWLIDQLGNIIIRNNFLSQKCSRKIINKDISAMIIELTSLRTKGHTSIPKDVKEMFGIIEGDLIGINIKDGNIIISKDIDNVLQIRKIYQWRPGRLILYLDKEIRDLLNADNKILWIFDEDGNIIIKNNNFPDDCLI